MVPNIISLGIRMIKKRIHACNTNIYSNCHYTRLKQENMIAKQLQTRLLSYNRFNFVKVNIYKMYKKSRQF